MKLKSFLMACAAACAITAPAMAEGGTFEGALPENWKADVVAGAKINWYNFSNWKAGGTSNYNWLVTYHADIQGNWSVANWRNLVDIELGQTWTEELGWRKSNDKLFWETMVDFNMPFSSTIKAYVGNRFETQIMSGYDYIDVDGETVAKAVSCFMDPAYETQVAGIAYIPNDNFSARGGFANRMTISDGYGFADDPDTKDKVETFRDEPGLEVVLEGKYAFSDVVSFKSRLWGFTNFQGVEKIDGKWENLLSVILTAGVELQAGFDMAYDFDQSKDAQYKSMVLFGVTWRWF